MPVSPPTRYGPVPLVWILDVRSGEHFEVELPSAAAWPTWSPDGEEIAFAFLADGAPVVGVVNVSSGEVEAIAEGLYPDWSPADGRIAVVRDYELWLVDRDSGDEEMLVGDRVLGPGPWSPDGSRIAFQTFGETLLDQTVGISPTDGTNSSNELARASFQAVLVPTWAPNDQLYVVYGPRNLGDTQIVRYTNGSGEPDFVKDLDDVMTPRFAANPSCP